MNAIPLYDGYKTIIILKLYGQVLKEYTTILCKTDYKW